MVAGAHPWTLAGPWYRWATPGAPASGRVSVPAIQKYETSDLVNEFIKNPQHSLLYPDSEDFVFEVAPRVPPIPLLKGKLQSFSNNTMRNTGIRKLFLDTHKRFYLVVCELHCDMPGFPSADRNDVCEAGFVVRRRSVPIPKNAEKPIRELILKGATPQEVQLLAKGYGIVAQLQGWIPSSKGFDRIGSWQPVLETPAVINTETIHPLYPLIPDPRVSTHAGKGRTIYFGQIPTGAADTDEQGNARFDDHTLYEIRCFVRRHKFPCPKTNKRNDCHGPLVWSGRTEQFQLATHFDLVGTSNRPVTIQMPDLPALQAQVADDPNIGRKAPVKMVSPAKSTLETSGKLPDLSPKLPSASICSFSIPLITIVATFVFKLFLPIVMFIFQLWWMLALKFCIPPSFSLSASVAADLSAQPALDIDGSLAADVSFAADVKANISLELGAEAATAIDQGSVDPNLPGNPGYSAGFQLAFAKNQSADLSDNPPAGTVVTGAVPSITANLQFMPEVKVS